VKQIMKINSVLRVTN